MVAVTQSPGLFLPVIPRSIPASWTYATGDETTEQVQVAHHLVDAGILNEWHLPAGKQTLKDAIAHALAEFATAARPRPLSTDLGVTLAGDLSSLGVEYDRYFKERELKIGVKNAGGIKALITSFNYENGMHVEYVGPTLKAIEAAWPRLGQTLLDVLEDGFMHGVRCLGPRQGIDWASHQYWSGEDNEIDHMRESLHGEGHGGWKEIQKWTDDQVRAEYAKQGYECFPRADYDKYFPRIWHHGCKPLKELPATLPPAADPNAGHGTPLMNVLCPELPATGALTKRQRRRRPAAVGGRAAGTFLLDKFREQWPATLELCQRIRRLLKSDTECDNGLCEQGTWENTPFMLRFDEDDCLPQIADDVWQMYFESGEHELSANAIFLWHDTATLATALTRLRNQLEVTQASEDLLRLLVAPTNPSKTRIKA